MMSDFRLRYRPSKPSAGKPHAMMRFVMYVRSRLYLPCSSRVLFVETISLTQFVLQQEAPRRFFFFYFTSDLAGATAERASCELEARSAVPPSSPALLSSSSCSPSIWRL